LEYFKEETMKTKIKLKTLAFSTKALFLLFFGAFAALNAEEQHQKDWEELKEIPSPWENFVFLEPNNPDLHGFFVASAEKELVGFVECHPLHKEFFYGNSLKSMGSKTKEEMVLLWQCMEIMTTMTFHKEGGNTVLKQEPESNFFVTNYFEKK